MSGSSAARSTIRRSIPAKSSSARSNCSASALILVHNHPSGDPTPSKADIAVTRDIVKAAKPLGVTVHDHLIIGRGRHTSLRDMGVLG